MRTPDNPPAQVSWCLGYIRKRYLATHTRRPKLDLWISIGPARYHGHVVGVCVRVGGHAWAVLSKRATRRWEPSLEEQLRP